MRMRRPRIAHLGEVALTHADTVVDVLEAEWLDADSTHPRVYQPLGALRGDIGLVHQELLGSTRLFSRVDQHDVTTADARVGAGEVAASQAAPAGERAVDDRRLTEEPAKVELVDARGAAHDVARRVKMGSEMVVQGPLALRAVVSLLPAPQPGELEVLDG